MSKTLIIPDVHGRAFWREAVAKKSYERIVFLGDYLDPYPHEGITQRHAYEGLLDIIDLKLQQPERVVLLLGNHDLHYYSAAYGRIAKGSRYNANYAWKYKKCFVQHRNLFQLAYEEEHNGIRYLFTHAGITQGWYEQHKNIIGELNAPNLNHLLDSLQGIETLTKISFFRGGDSMWGSCIWTDIAEIAVSIPFDNIYQVFGHSQSEKPYISPDWACLDCRMSFILQDSEIKTVE